MALNPNDSNLLLLYSLDESGPLATRSNLGSLGSTDDLIVGQSAGTDGIPTVSDGNAGRAIDNFLTRTGYTSAYRYLRSARSANLDVHPCCPKIPSVATEDWAFGCRFQWKALNTGGGANESEAIMGVRDFASSSVAWGLSIAPNDPTTPTRAFLKIDWYSSLNSDVTAANYTSSGDAVPWSGNYFLYPDEWYRVTVRVVFTSGTSYKYVVYVLRESTGDLYILTQNTPQLRTDWPASNASAFGVGDYATSANPIPMRGYTDDVWLYGAPLSDADAQGTTLGGLSIPWSEPNYTYNDHDVRFTHANETSDFPVPRALPTGCSSVRVPMPAWGTRLRTKLKNFRPSRPMSLRQGTVMFDTAGPRYSKADVEQSIGGVAQGLIRQPGVLPAGSLIDVSDIDLSGLSLRRRRGFRVRRDADNDITTGYNAFATFRDFDDSLFHVIKAGTTLYAETGSGVTALDTGWPATDQPVFASLDGRLLVLTRNNQKIWDGDPTSIDDIGCETPTGGSVAATIGTLVGTYAYAYTFYDPTSGDESTPKEVGSVTLATEGAALTSLDNTPANARFSKQRIYRTTAGGTIYYLIVTQNLGTTYTDSGATDGTVELATRDQGDTFITSTPPDTFAAATVHMERVFYFMGSSYPAKIWPSEPNEPCRWDDQGSIECEGPIMAAIGQGSRLIVFTRHTVELIESDWIRDADGNRQVRRTVLSRRVGCLGPNAVCDAHGQIYWIDQRGIYTLMGDQVVPVSQAIAPIFPAMNVGIGRYFVARYNHIRQQVWFCIALADYQTDNSRMLSQLVLHLGEQPRWSMYHLNACWAGEFDDDLNGMRFGIMDHNGVFKEMESYEGDGVDDPSDVTLCEGTISSIDTARTTVTVTGSPGWTTDAMRGYGIVFLDNSTGLTYYRTIVANGAATVTFVEPLPAALAATDNYYIGGIDCFVEFAENHFGSTNLKVARTWYGEFDDLTTGRWR